MSETSLAPREEIIDLLDEYEPLLSPSQSEALIAYYRYDLSIGEIAEEKGVSRSAVLDAIQKGVAKLKKSEEELKSVRLKGILRDGLGEIVTSTDLEKARDRARKLLETIENGI